MDTVSDIMRNLVNLDRPSIARVNVHLCDWREDFVACATLRQTGREYTASGLTPLTALIALRQVLYSLTCPQCGQVRDMPEAEMETAS